MGHLRVRGRAADAYTPCSAVRDEYCCCAGKDNGREQNVAVLWWEVGLERLVAPVLKDEGADGKNGDRQEVVVEHRVPVLESSDLDALLHEQDVGGRAGAVESHPDVADRHAADTGYLCDLATCGLVEHGTPRKGDVGPCGDHRGADHERKCNKSKASDMAAEHEHLSVCNEDDGEVLEDAEKVSGALALGGSCVRVNVDGKELLRVSKALGLETYQRLGTSVDDSNKKTRHWPPLLGILDVPVTDWSSARVSDVCLHVMKPARLTPHTARTHTADWIASSKKFIEKLAPDTTYCALVLFKTRWRPPLRGCDEAR